MLHEGYKYNEMKNTNNSEYVNWKQLYNVNNIITCGKFINGCINVHSAPNISKELY